MCIPFINVSMLEQQVPGADCVVKNANKYITCDSCQDVLICLLFVRLLFICVHIYHVRDF